MLPVMLAIIAGVEQVMKPRTTSLTLRVDIVSLCRITTRLSNNVFDDRKE